MRLANKPRLIALLAGIALVSAIPALSQDAPKSLLPPGFGEPDAPPKDDGDASRSKPTDLLPDVQLRVPGSKGPSASSSDPLSD